MGIRIGIVGAGTTVAIADRHVEGFLAQAGRCTVTAVCSRTLEGCRRLCIRHGLDGVRMTTRLEELLDVVDAVVLCTPNQFHLPYTERAVERGKAVLLEKPLGLQTAPPGQAGRRLARGGARGEVGYVYPYTALGGGGRGCFSRNTPGPTPPPPGSRGASLAPGGAPG